MISGFAFAAGPVSTPNGEPHYNGMTFKGFIQVRADRELFVDYVAPKENMPTLVVLNGLTYSTLQWDRFIEPLVQRGVGIVRYDMFGMGQTLLKYRWPVKPITYEEQVDDLKQLLTIMKIRAPYNIVGLSYGGGIGIAYGIKYRKDIGNLILMAPFTQAVEAQDTMIKNLIFRTRAMFPLLNDDQLYDMYLKQLVYTTYPTAEPVFLTNPYGLEGVFRMVQGIRKFRPIEQISKLPENIHMMVAGKDQYIGREVLDGYWDKVPDKAKASRILVNDVEHKIPEVVPNFAAAWIYQIIVKKNPLLFQGQDFQGYPTTGEVVYKGGKFKISGKR
jgi:pimeloyl-ACP methyl ester carboxylesterase